MATYGWLVVATDRPLIMTDFYSNKLVINEEFWKYFINQKQGSLHIKEKTELTVVHCLWGQSSEKKDNKFI